VNPVLRHWPWVALVSCLLLLGAAHAFETFGRLAPCELCLKARSIYWAAAAVALVLGVLRLTPLKPPVWSTLLLAAIFVGGAALGAYHSGVEWHFWPGPKSCTGGNVQVSLADMSRLLNGGPVAAPACDKAAWRFLGLSMAGWNVLISLKLAVLSALAARIATPETRS
jgi:disulfide bond formation protein DsbB